MSKRTLDAYLKPARSSTTDTSSSQSSSKKLKVPSQEHIAASQPSASETESECHPSYPFAIRTLPSHLSSALKTTVPARAARTINNQPHLDLLYFEPFIPRPTADEYFKFLRRELPFYRVKYTIKRGPTETVINTPRYTTVFGIDGTSYFSIPKEEDSKAERNKETRRIILDSKTNQPIPAQKYKCTPRPIPSCLDALRQLVERTLNDGTSYNFVLVNYYASGDDSISYHSDDERFLGSLPNIASLTLGARRDFLMKHKPAAGSGGNGSKDKPLKIPLGSGDMVIMRGETQSNWLHSIPKRKGKSGEGGRINITFRKGVKIYATENYYQVRCKYMLQECCHC